MIGVVTFAIAVLGIRIGEAFGAKIGSRAEFAGGAILILIGAKILLEHLGVLGL
jgi:putative Mn2+ efflux pump MntP